MVLNQENEDEKKATFLDLEEEVKNGVIVVKTYDKREAFKFEIVNYPDLTGNIPKKPAYGIYSSQIIRYARNCSEEKDLAERITDLTKKLLKKKFAIQELRLTLKKCLRKNTWIQLQANSIVKIFRVC